MACARLSSLGICLLLWLASMLVAPACQVPVFRYALERWAPAEYLVSIVPAESGLTDAEKKAVEVLRAAPGDSANPVNLEIQIEPAAAGTRGPAQIALHYPHKLRDARKEPIWQAPLTEQNVQRLLDSPVRRELRRRLLAGESAIWLLVESGARAQDDAASESLTQALAEELPRGMGAIPLNPGIIDTDMLRSCFGGTASRYPSPQKWVEKAVPFILALNSRDSGKQLTIE